MHIGFLSEKYPPEIGGLAISSARLCRGLAQCGHAVEVFTPTTALAPGARQTTTIDDVVCHTIGVHKRSEETLSAWFAAVLARHQARPFALLHAYFMPQAGFLATYLGRYLGIPVVVSARGNDLDRAIFDPGRAGHILYALQQADVVTANTRDLVRKAQALAPGRTVHLIPNGVDTGRFAPQPRDERLVAALGLEGRPVLGFVGEARAKKGLATLLTAYRELYRHTGAALLLVGGVRAGEDQALVTVFQKQNPAAPLVVVPYVAHEALPSYYNLLDLLLLPSLADGLPNALLEGMACGCAVVGAAAGGIPDVVHHAENGLLVPPQDAPALVAACSELLADADLRAQLGAAARRSVQEEFSVALEVQRNLELYGQLCNDSISV